MDLPVPDLQKQQDGDEPGVRSGRETESVDALAAAEKEFFNLAPVSEVEQRFTHLQSLVTELAVIARKRRQALEAERCAICGSPWKRKLPDGGMVPQGTEFWENPKDRKTYALYACDQACYSKLQWECKKQTFQLRMERDEERLREHAERASKRPRLSA